MIRALVILLALASCKSKPWRDDRATEITVGPYTIAIPAGWRNVGELHDREIAKETLSAGYSMLVKDDFPDKGKGPSIVFNWIMMSGPHAPNCEGVKSDAPPTQIDVEGDVVCLWSNVRGKLLTSGAIRFHNDAQLVVVCGREVDGEKDVDAACTAVLASLHIKR
jgi:hypothetical protein